MREKLLEDDDLDDQVLRRPSLLQKETLMLCHLLQFPRGGVNMWKRDCEGITNGPDETMELPEHWVRTIDLFRSLVAHLKNPLNAT